MKIEELLDELKWDTHYPYHREIAAEILFLFSALTKQVEELKKELQAWKDSRDGVIQEISDYTIKIADLTARLAKAEQENAELKKKVEVLKCCHNCYNMPRSENCYPHDEWHENPRKGCIRWQSDNLTREERSL